MLASVFNFFTRRASDSTRRGSDPPPLYQTNDPLSEPSLNPSEQHTSASEGLNETPQRRFAYHIALRKKQQLEQWSRTWMDIRLYQNQNLETQNTDARDWVIKQWQIYGIWVSTWPVTGPGDQEKWECGSPEGIPDCLFSMELVWEIQHNIRIGKPVLLPCLAAAQTRLPAVIPPVKLQPHDLGVRALGQLLERWEDEGFSSSTIQQSTLAHRRDLGDLYEWLPRLARDMLDSLNVTSWHDLLRGWEEKIGDYTSDLLGVPLPPGSQERAITAVRAVQAESLRVETLRQVSLLEAPVAQQEVTRAAILDGTDGPGAEEMRDTSGRQSRAVEMSGMSETSIESREIPSEAAHDAPEPTNRRSIRRARRNATRPTKVAKNMRDKDIARRGAAVSTATAEGMGSTGSVASRRRPRRAQG